MMCLLIYCEHLNKKSTLNNKALTEGIPIVLFVMQENYKNSCINSKLFWRGLR